MAAGAVPVDEPAVLEAEGEPALPLHPANSAVPVSPAIPKNVLRVMFAPIFYSNLENSMVAVQLAETPATPEAGLKGKHIGLVTMCAGLNASSQVPQTTAASAAPAAVKPTEPII